MKTIILLLLAAICTMSMFSCSQTEATELTEPTITINYDSASALVYYSFKVDSVDDETGYAYGVTQDTTNADIKHYLIVVPYSAIKYDAMMGYSYSPRLLGNAIVDSTNTLASFTLLKHELLAN